LMIAGYASDSPLMRYDPSKPFKVGGRDASAPEEQSRAHRCLVEDVLPALRQATS